MDITLFIEIISVFLIGVIIGRVTKSTVVHYHQQPSNKKEVAPIVKKIKHKGFARPQEKAPAISKNYPIN